MLRTVALLVPDNLAYAVALGEALLAQGENEDAAVQFQKVLLVAPESPRSAQMLDEAYKRLNTPEAQRNAWQAITDAHPEAEMPKKHLQEIAQ